ncbi:MAG: AAA family ATPase [Polaromonas sp.]
MEADTAAAAPVDETLVLALRARLEADTGQPVALVETHISWVLLAGGFAYKLKKPVRLPFVDFSTLALRQHFCLEELRLNRRLAPALYLGVVPVRGTALAPRIGALGPIDDDDDDGSDDDDGAGPVIDYAVCMQRFAPGALLSERLAAGGAGVLPEQLDGLARRLADFHRDAPVTQAADAAQPDGRPVRKVLEQLEQLQAEADKPQLAALRAWVDGQWQALHEVWSARRQTGAMRECHGDLHLANTVLIGNEVTAFDCIEFDPALRRIDVMSDVAFLTMDLKAHGRGDLAFRFLDVWLQHSGDYPGLRVLRFYEVYRALVRALVARVRSRPSRTTSTAHGPDYLACARRLVDTAGGRQARLLITHGLSGSGKSTVAGQLLEAAGAIRLRSDVERKRLFGLGALQRSAGQAVDIYTPEASRRTFARLADCARTALQAGYPVIVDAAFLHRAERRAFRALAAELRVPFSVLHCHASHALLRQRVAARDAGGRDASEADVEVLDQQLARHEPLDADERAAVLEVATDGPVDMADLRARWFARG